MNDRTTITLPKTRALQLHELAARRKLKVSDLIAAWIVREYEEASEQPSYSDCEIKVIETDRVVTLKAELFQEHTIDLTPAQAASLGVTFEHAIEFEGAHKRGFHMLDVDAGGFVVSRRGAAVVFTHGDYRKTMPLGTAREIANELQDAGREYSQA